MKVVVTHRYANSKKAETVTKKVLPVLYGCETRAFVLRRECRLSVFENRVLWEVFGPKREETGDWRI
jgi:hypothetical protein